MTPLHLACGPATRVTPQQFEICRLLIAAKADVNRTGYKYVTSRHMKAERSHFFERCNDHLVFSASTPLHEAAYYNKVDICRMLIACKANVAAKDMCGHRRRAAPAFADPISLAAWQVQAHAPHTRHPPAEWCSTDRWKCRRCCVFAKHWSSTMNATEMPLVM